jgi:outer membrane protein assembly factor BamE (lipoprotein component of BamABCDE complex)
MPSLFRLTLTFATVTAALVASAVATPVFAQPKPSGFTCCNLRNDTSADWINDIGYTSGTVLIPIGSPAVVTDYGRYRFFFTINGKKHRMGNDYSRDLSNEAFAARWIVSEDPKLKIAKFPADIQKAIAEGKIRKGMTREQVIMSLGHPVTSETPDAKSNLYRYWLSSFEEYQVSFDGDRVKEIIAAPAILTRVQAGN